MQCKQDSECCCNPLASAKTGKEREHVPQYCCHSAYDLKHHHRLGAFRGRVEEFRQHYSQPSLEEVKYENGYARLPSEHPYGVCGSGVAAAMLPDINSVK